MSSSKLTKLESEVLEILLRQGACSTREIHEALPQSVRPAFTTIQSIVYRMMNKQSLRLVKRVGNANIFEAAISRSEAQTSIVEELLALFGGMTKPVVAHLVKTGKLTL